MNPVELRIGNLVYFPLIDEFCEITRDMFEYRKGLANLEDYRPIPLSENILLKCYFEKYEDDDDYFCIQLNSKGLELCFNAETGRVLIGQDIAYSDEIISVKYVHQLQNIYFALTGEEIKFKQ